MDSDAKVAFEHYCEHLAEHQIPYQINPLLVRGLDYYNGPVFEWITDDLGAQGTLCAGGRYDALTESIGGMPTPALGYAFGLERLIEMIAADKRPTKMPVASVLVTDNDCMPYAVHALEQLRASVPALGFMFTGVAGPLKKGLKSANKDTAAYAILVGETETNNNTLTIKHMQTGEQQTLPLTEAITYLSGALS